MRQLQQQVREFHIKHSFDMDRNLRVDTLKGNFAANIELQRVSQLVNEFAQKWQNGTLDPNIPNSPSSHDSRLMRAHLILEEAAEAIKALASGDEKELLDALADLSYVTAGTAVAYDLPLAEACDEVHRSNMTKEVRAGGDKDVRCRKKGDSYEPPDIEGILRRYRGASE